MTTRKALPDGTSDGSDGQIFTRPTLCSHNHAALKLDESAWQAAGFAGYQPLGRQLGEARHCPRCQSTVVRLVAFTRALTHVVERLTDPPVSELYLHSASMLASWARENIPSDLGIADDPTEPPTSPPTAAAATADWRQLGKRYVQDQPLDWGCAIEREAESLDAWCAPGSTRAPLAASARPDPNPNDPEAER